MKRLLRSIAVPGAAALALVASGCRDRPPEVRLGMTLSPESHLAVQLATAEINAAGGIDGIPLRLVGLEWHRRDTDTPPQAAEVLRRAEKLADDPHLLGVVGPSDSASTLTSGGVYNRVGVPQIVTIATNPAITNLGEWTYRLCISDAAQGPALAEYAVREWGKRRIALFYANDDYGRGLARTFRARAEQLGAEIVSSVFHPNRLEPRDEAVLGSVLDRLAASPQPPDLFFLIQRMPAGPWTIAAIRERWPDADILGADNFGLHSFVATWPELSEGTRTSAFFVPAAAGPRGEDFARRFRAAAHRAPDYGDAFAYDAVYLFRDAVLNGGFDRQGVRGYLDQVIARGDTLQGVSGAYRLAPDHDARRDFYIVEVVDGSFQVIKKLSTT